MCVYECMYTCAHIYGGHMYMWRPEVGVRCLSHILHHSSPVLATSMLIEYKLELSEMREPAYCGRCQLWAHSPGFYTRVG